MKISPRTLILSALGLLLAVLIAVGAWSATADDDNPGRSAATGPTGAAPSYNPTPSTSAEAGEENGAAASATPEASPTPTMEPSVAASIAAGFENSSDHQQAPEAQDWRENAEAYANPHGGDKEAWLAGMAPYATERMLEQFEYTDMANVIDDEVEIVESVRIEATTMTFSTSYAENGEPYEALMVLEPSGEWKVTALGAPGAHEAGAKE